MAMMSISTTSGFRCSDVTVLRLILIACIGVLHVQVGIAHSDLLLQIDAVSRQLELEPNNDALLIKRGDLYRRHLDYEAAERDFSAARKANPANPLNDFFSGRLALETGDAQAADILLSRHVQQQPQDAAAWVLRGRAGMALGEFDRAAEDFAHAIERSPRPSPELFRLQVLALVAGDQYAKALEVLDAGLARIPGEVNLIALAADTSLVAGDNDRAALYMSLAPEPLFQIERWQQLRARVTCSDERIGTTPDACLDQAVKDLNRQIEAMR